MTEAKMEQRNECDRCGKRFTKISLNGMCGYCELHGWCPLSDDRAAVAEAARLNHQKQQKESRIRSKKRVLDQWRTIGRKLLALRKYILILVVVGLIAGGAVKFVAIPKMNYNAAKELLLEGACEEAKEAFAKLGSYGDSEGNVLLCDAIISLRENDLDSAIRALKELEENEDEKNAAALRSSLQPVLAKWKENGISAETLLSLLKQSELIDPEDHLGKEKLSEEAHAEMALTEDTKAWCAIALGEEKEKTLLLLHQDYTVTAYRMREEENQDRVLDARTEADCLLIFGEQLSEPDPETAVACRQASLTKAETAFQEVRTTETFRFYYEIMEAYCRIQEDSGQAAELWEEFVQKNSAFLVSCDMEGEAKELSGTFQLAYAKDLMAREDPSCSAWLGKAWENGADIEDTLSAAVECFSLGRTRTELRLMEIKFCGENSEKALQQKELLRDELQTQPEKWQDAAIPPEDVLYLLTVAEKQGIALDIDVELIYEKAFLGATAGEQWKKYVFTDFDMDGKSELLGLNAENQLRYYAMQEENPVCMSSLAFEMTGYDLRVEESNAVVVESEDQDAFAVCVYSESAMKCVYEISGIQNYQHSETILTYECTLPGSIERSRQYRYDLTKPEQEPVVEGIYWQQDAYPVPDTAKAAAVRYIEALSYQIPEERELLTAKESGQVNGFSFEVTESLRMPEDLSKIQAVPYDVTENRVLLEISYPASDGEVQMYAAAFMEDGWKIAGFSESFLPDGMADSGDLSVSLFPLNDEISGSLRDKNAKDVYRMLFTAPSRIQMVWQAGEKQGKQEAFLINFYEKDTSADPLISYRVKLSPAKQISMPLFVPEGLYYVTVEAVTYSDCTYHLSIQAVQDSYVETEENDTADNANELELNQAYSGSLSDKHDVDYFRFTLKQPGAVHLLLGGSGQGSRQSCYRISLINAANGKVLSSAEMNGNSKEMDTGAVYVGAGDYIVRMEKGTVWLGMEYTLTAEYTPLGQIEQESNDTSDTATVVSVNDVIKGSIGTEGDVDCFCFTLEKDAIVQPRLTVDPLESSGKAHVVSILKGTETLLARNIGGRESDIQLQPLVLKAGDYTLRLENIRFDGQEYSLQLVCEEIRLAEDEPNGTKAQANDLIIGEEQTGVLSSPEDVDWYHLVMEKEQEVTFTVKYEQGSKNDTIFIFQMEQNGKAIIRPLKLKESSGGGTWKLSLSPGEYYIAIKPDEWKGCIYTLSLQ